MIPESWQIEIAIVGGESRLGTYAKVEIDSLFGFQLNGQLTYISLLGCHLRDYQGQTFGCLQLPSVLSQLKGDGRIAGLFQTKRIFSIQRTHLRCNAKEERAND